MYIRKLKTLLRVIDGCRYYKLNIFDILNILGFIVYFKLEKWHITQLASATKYQKFIIKKINSDRKFKRILDVGCGLGIISRKLKVESYIGLDQQQEIIYCAGKINKSDKARFEKRNLDNIIDYLDVDVVLCVNLLHRYEVDEVFKIFCNWYEYKEDLKVIFDYNVKCDVLRGELIQRLAVEELSRDVKIGRKVYILEGVNKN